jgi:hypothetical protein
VNMLLVLLLMMGSRPIVPRHCGMGKPPETLGPEAVKAYIGGAAKAPEYSAGVVASWRRESDRKRVAVAERGRKA